jgi:hypothetical protein
MKQQAQSESLPDVKGVTYEEEIQVIRDKLDSTNSINYSELAFLTHEKLTDELEQWAQENEVPFLDIRERLNEDRDVLWSWVHLKPRGNKMIAEALSDEIKQRLN